GFDCKRVRAPGGDRDHAREVERLNRSVTVGSFSIAELARLPGAPTPDGAARLGETRGDRERGNSKKSDTGFDAPPGHRRFSDLPDVTNKAANQVIGKQARKLSSDLRFPLEDGLEDPPFLGGNGV